MGLLKPNSSLKLRLALTLALVAALMPGVFHTIYTFQFFHPTAEDFFPALWPWGPLMAGVWLRHLPRVAAAILFFLSLPGLGGLLLRACRLGRWRHFFADVGAALAFWSILGFVLAAAGACQPRTLQVISLLLCIGGFFAFPSRYVRRPVLPRDLTSRLLIFGLVAGGLILGLTSLVPETFYDALSYHLGVPHSYLLTGHLVDQPDNHLTRLPGMIQTLYLWGLAWGDDRFCKLMNLGFYFLFVSAPAAWVGRLASRRAGLWAALLLASCPLIVVNAWSCTNDLLSGFFLFLAVALWVDIEENSLSGLNLSPSGTNAGTGARAYALAGFFFGAAAAVKYTALFAAPFFALELAVGVLRARNRGEINAAAFGGGAILPLLPWWIRTGIWTGNPFFPKAAKLLGGAIPQDIALLKNWESTLTAGTSFWDRLLSLFQESVNGVQHGRFGFIGPALIMTLLLLLFLRDRKSLRPMMMCAMISYIFFAISSGRTRYFIPELPLFFVLGTVCLEDYLTASGQISSVGFRKWLDAGRWLQVGLGAAVLFNALWLVLVFQRYNQGWDVVWGRQSERDYLRVEHIGAYGNPSQRAYEYLAAHNDGGKLFLIGEARTFRSPLPARASGAFNVPSYAVLETEAPTPRDFVHKLRADGYSYLLVNVPETKRVTPGDYRTDPYLRFLSSVFDMLSPPLYRDDWTILFKIRQIA